MPPLGFVSDENRLGSPLFLQRNKSGPKAIGGNPGEVLPAERPSGAGHRLRAADRRSPGG